MAKTNYTKVEDALTAGLQKISIDRLLELADAAEGKDSPTDEQTRLRGQVLLALHTELQYLKSKGQHPYSKLNVDKKNLKKYLDDPALLTPEEWEKIKTIKKNLDAFKKSIAESLPQQSDDALIEEERKKQKNKRFNVNDKWLPL